MLHRPRNVVMTVLTASVVLLASGAARVGNELEKLEEDALLVVTRDERPLALPAHHQVLDRELVVSRNPELSAVLIAYQEPTAATWEALTRHMEAEDSTACVCGTPPGIAESPRAAPRPPLRSRGWRNRRFAFAHLRPRSALGLAACG